MLTVGIVTKQVLLTGFPCQKVIVSSTVRGHQNTARQDDLLIRGLRTSMARLKTACHSWKRQRGDERRDFTNILMQVKSMVHGQ
jgi:hypothetical protein